MDISTPPLLPLPSFERCPRSVVYGRANIDEEFVLWAAALERLLFEVLMGTNPRTGTVPREASSLSRQLQADSADLPRRVRRTLGVATPHKGENKKRG